MNAQPDIHAELPDLSRLSRTNFPDRLLNLFFGMGAYPAPTQFQLTTAARLLDKVLADWDSARAEFAEHRGTRDGLPAIARPRGPGITRALFRAIGRLEDVVNSLARLLRLVEALQASPDLQQLSHLPLPDKAECGRVRRFRNRIEHGDQDIASGKAGQGLATATLWPGPTQMELQDHHLVYDDLARMLEVTCTYLRAASEEAPQPA